LVDGEQGRGFGEPGDAQEEAAVSFAAPPAQGSSVIADVVERSTERLSRIEGVHGIAVGRTAIGDDSVRIDVEDDSVRERLPDEIEGYPVEVVVVPGGFGTLPAGSPYTG
jgi:hypothetical protein